MDSRFQKEQNIQVDRSIIMQEELGKTQWVADGLLYKDLCDNSAANIEWLVDQCGCELEGTIDNYPFGVSVGSVDTFHWWKDGAAYVGYVMPMQQKLRDAAADIRLNNRALEFSYDENGAINGRVRHRRLRRLGAVPGQSRHRGHGGFADDDRRMTKWGFDLTTLERIGTPGHFGDGINMTIAAGARGVQRRMLLEIQPHQPSGGEVRRLLGSFRFRRPHALG